MITCSKYYGDIPFAHRQHLHPGPCSRIHGHNWAIKITFACSHFDNNGFVVDFGNLKYIKEYFDEHLDHACIFSNHDPLAHSIISSSPKGIFKPYWVDNASCEGIAQHLYLKISELVEANEGNRVWINELELHEDEKNSVRLTPVRNK
ncbi:6-carboxytetrahydropterin synthase [Verrucomicrobia bacterium LW23]|nr:6-carboxytetrahydropterin synthase [Verrucomicrobia bacterium LW23]